MRDLITVGTGTAGALAVVGWWVLRQRDRLRPAPVPVRTPRRQPRR